MTSSTVERLQRGFAAVVVAAAISLPAPALGQATAEDEGTFEVTVGGRKAGTEQFTIRQSGIGANSEIVATGRVDVTLPTGSVELAPRLRTTGFEADPVSYEVTIGGDSPRRIVGSVGSGRFSARIVTPTGEQLREYVATSGATILDEGVAHHYYFLVRRVRSGRVPILIPRENRQVMATVTDRGEERIAIGGSTVTLYHIVVRPEGGEERHVWIDSLNRVIRVEIPDRQYVAVRTQIPQ